MWEICLKILQQGKEAGGKKLKEGNREKGKEGGREKRMKEKDRWSKCGKMLVMLNLKKGNMWVHFMLLCTFYVLYFYESLKTFIVKKYIFSWTKLSSVLIPGLPEEKSMTATQADFWLTRSHDGRDKCLSLLSCSGHVYRAGLKDSF